MALYLLTSTLTNKIILLCLVKVKLKQIALKDVNHCPMSERRPSPCREG